MSLMLLFASFAMGPAQLEVVTSDGVAVANAYAIEKIEGPRNSTCSNVLPWPIQCKVYTTLAARELRTGASGVANFPRLRGRPNRDKSHSEVYYSFQVGGVEVPGCPETIWATPELGQDCALSGDLLPNQNPLPARVTCRLNWTDRQLRDEIEKLRSGCQAGHNPTHP